MSNVLSCRKGLNHALWLEILGKTFLKGKEKIKERDDPLCSFRGSEITMQAVKRRDLDGIRRRIGRKHFVTSSPWGEVRE